LTDMPARKRLSVVLASTLSALAVVAGIIGLGVITDSPMVTATSATESNPATAPGDPLAAPVEGDGTAVENQVEGQTEASDAAASAVTGDVSQIKNVVLLLADDLDWPLWNDVPRLKAFMDEGTTLTNFVVTESLCCPSRTSIMRGQYVHNHDVISNIPQTGGGWQTFYDLGHQKDCLANWLSAGGVRTAHVGKYLNGFPGRDLKPSYTPPGWNYFVSTTRGKVAYTGYNYTLNTNGELQKYYDGPYDFLENVLTAKASEFIDTTTEPFYLEFSSYLPHSPAPASPTRAGTRAGSQTPRLPNYNAAGIYEPKWLKKQKRLGPKQHENLNNLWTRRLESAESMADSFEALYNQLRDSGRMDDTLVIVTSDNGYHVGAHRLPNGKHTPYREDSVVPAVFIGPGIAKGVTIDKMTSTIDLAPTIANLQGAQTPAFLDGRDLMPLLVDPENAPWRTGVLTENLAPTTKGDPDYSGFEAPKYDALRTEQYLYVDYGRKQGAALYNLQTDPYELNNVIRSTDPVIVAQLARQTKALAKCSGASCRVADSMPVGLPDGS
jgi:N-acetylglucosamine-6-sulfatase